MDIRKQYQNDLQQQNQNDQQNLKKEYQKPQVQEDLYQYEMGIELGADVEADKQLREKEYLKKLQREKNQKKRK